MSQLWRNVVLEINSDCNRKCWFCNRHGDNKDRFFDERGRRVNEFMPMEHVESILEQLVAIRPGGMVYFGHMSEPTLDDRLAEITAMFKRRGFQIMVHSNGDNLSQDKTLCDAVGKSIDLWNIGIYDVKGKSDKEIEEKKRWWTNRLSPVRAVFSVATTRFQRRFSGEEKKKTGYPNTHCMVPNKNLVIYYDGKVALCCEDINCDFDLGNVFDTPIIDIWNSPRRLELVNGLANKRSHHPICAACPIVPGGGMG